MSQTTLTATQIQNALKASMSGLVKKFEAHQDAFFPEWRIQMTERDYNARFHAYCAGVADGAAVLAEQAKTAPDIQRASEMVKAFTKYTIMG